MLIIWNFRVKIYSNYDNYNLNQLAKWQFISRGNSCKIIALSEFGGVYNGKSAEDAQTHLNYDRKEMKED